jgi:DNA-binding MarR family transcriptional regulator
MNRVSVEQFADRMSEIMPVIIKEFARRQTDEFYKGKLTFPQFLVLEFLRRSGESKMTTLANFMGVTTPAMTGIVDRLVKYGYVLRIFDPQDRRIIKIKLATKGTELVKKINQQRRQMIIKIFGQLSERDRQDYLRILLQIKDILIKRDLVAK